MTLSFTVRRATWTTDHSLIKGVRETVFVQEQGIPAHLEWDSEDTDAVHVLALLPGGEAIGTGRLLRSGVVGRMAVLRPYRSQGVGRALLAGLLDAARERGDGRVMLSAQTRVVGFYERMGFTAFGDIYFEAGIPHQRMQRELQH